MIDIYKNKSKYNYDQMNSPSNRICKGKCVNYKAKRPKEGSRYAVGQVRCQICEIYLIPQGVKDNRVCKCCNFKVRTKPRNSLIKERYKEKISEQQKSEIKQEVNDENWWLEESTKERIKQDLGNDKKSTPIYEETDNSIKTYYEFKEFLDSTMKLQANYQLVMLKELLEYGRLHKGEIAESLAYFNNKDSSDINVVKQFFNVPVYNVLLNHELVTVVNSPNYPHIPYFSLNVKLTDNQKITMLEDLSNRLTEYNMENNILENEFPKANNMGSINWNATNKNLLINYKSNNPEAES